MKSKLLKKGLRPIRYKDHRTYDFHKTFGTATQVPDEFNFDATGIFPDQNKDGYPNGCTAYATNDIASCEDGIYYDDQPFTYANTKLIEGVSGQVPVLQTNALKSATVYGLKKKSETPDQALTHRRAPYFIVKKLNGSYFDGMVSAMWVKQGCLSVGSPWLVYFEEVNGDGVVAPFTPPKSFTEGHNWSAVGVKVVKGEPCIICKSWQGPNFGNKGYIYFTKKQIDDLLSVPGIGVFGQKQAKPDDIKRVEMSIIEVIISYLYQLIAKIP